MNLFLGLVKGVEGLPNDLRRLGYSDRWIELAFTNREGQTVKPELILSSSKLNHSILIECKSGANTEADQLNRYNNLTSEDLRTKAYLQSQEWGAYDVAIVGKGEHEDRLKIGLQNKFLFPLLVFTDTGLRKALHRFKPEEVENFFKSEVRFDPEQIPHFFFPVDKDSQLWEFAEVLMPVVLECLLQRKVRVEAHELAVSIIPTWEIVDTSYRGEIENKVRDVLQAASQAQFRKYLKRNKQAEAKTHTPTWDIVFNPFELQADKRSAEWRRLIKLQANFLHTLRTGGTPALQEELFD